MKKTRKSNNSKGSQKSNYTFSKHQTIGAPDAESDHNLEKVFIENGELEVLENLDNAKCIIIGRTGSGKSALIKMFEERHSQTTKRISPEEMSLNYISNSTILTYFRNLGVNLNFFYKILWKHIFVVEILKLYIQNDAKKKDAFFERIKNWGTKNPAREKAIKYLEEWSDEFWEKAEYRIKELEDQAIKQFSAEAGASNDVFKLGVSANDSHQLKVTSELRTKAEQVINSLQAKELVEVINLMRDNLLQGQQRKHYIVIDDLDKEWVSAQIVYDLIASMIEVIKEFQTFKSVKIIIALRDNLHQMVFAGYEHRGGQREKFSHLYLKLDWDEKSLYNLLNERLKLITDNLVDAATVFEKSGTGAGFDYILQRTFMRPRDVISFVNAIIKKANSKHYFDQSLVKAAESDYSLERLHAIEDEWGENFGDLRRLWPIFSGIHNGFKLAHFNEDRFADIYVNQETIKTFKGDLFDAFNNWVDNKNTNAYKNFLSRFFYLMYIIGVIGIKKTGQDGVTFFYSTDSFIAKHDFTSEARIYVHKSFYHSLKIMTKSLEAGHYI